MVVGDGRLQAASDMGKEKYKKVLDEVRKKKKKAEMEGKMMMALGEEEEEDVASAGVKGKDDEGEDNGKMGGDVEKRKRSSSDDVAANNDDAKSNKAKGSAPKRPTGGSYTAAEAQSAYDHISKYHKKEGCELYYLLFVLLRRDFFVASDIIACIDFLQLRNPYPHTGDKSGWWSRKG
jgi:hypothetical protein